MVAAKRREKADLISAREAFAVASPDEAADIAPDEGLAGKPGVLKGGTVEGGRSPVARRVAGPHRGVALDGGVGRAGDVVGAPVGREPLQAFVCRARLEERE